MKPALLELLACPRCRADLTLQTETVEAGEIVTGSLTCRECAGTYPIIGGIPRFAPTLAGVEAKTAQAFGYEWTHYSELAQRYRQQFLDWIRPVAPEFLAGKLVLEGGCGKGRHTALAAEFGVRAIVALDLSQAVEAAYANAGRFPTVHIVQADLNAPPVKRIFEYAFSIGVLHHLPDPERGFRALVSRLRPGGAMSAWVYGREGNGWIVRLVSPVRRHITSRLPHRLLDFLSAALTVPLYAATRLLYRPARGRAAEKLLPYRAYLSYIADFPFREQRSIVFDHLAAPIAFYVRREEFASWFDRAGLVDVVIQPHNANSWRGFGKRPVRIA